MSLNLRRVSWPPSSRPARRKPQELDIDEDFGSFQNFYELVGKAKEVFKSPGDLWGLREKSGWRVSSTPSWATNTHFQCGPAAILGVAAEAIALLFFYLATVEHESGEELERRWDAIDFYFEKSQYVKTAAFCFTRLT